MFATRGNAGRAARYRTPDANMVMSAGSSRYVMVIKGDQRDRKRHRQASKWPRIGPTVTVIESSFVLPNPEPSSGSYDVVRFAGGRATRAGRCDAIYCLRSFAR